MKKKSFGVELCAFRRQLGMSRLVLARELGCAVNSVRGWERGEHKPGPMARIMIAGFIGEVTQGVKGGPDNAAK